jgi:hypothetical protein
MKNMRGKTLIHLHTTRGVHLTRSTLQDKQYVLNLKKNRAIRPISFKKQKKKKKKKTIKKATSSMKIQPYFLQAAYKLDTATSTRLVVSFQPVSNVILGRQVTCSTTVLSLVTDKPVQSFSPVVLCSTHTTTETLHRSIYCTVGH